MGPGDCTPLETESGASVSPAAPDAHPGPPALSLARLCALPLLPMAVSTVLSPPEPLSGAGSTCPSPERRPHTCSPTHWWARVLCGGPISPDAPVLGVVGNGAPDAPVLGVVEALSTFWL